MKTRQFSTACFAVITCLLFWAATIAHGADDMLVTIAGVTGSNGGDRYANGMVSITNGSGIAKSDPLDPATWTFSGALYQDEWMANPLVGALNSKIAWATVDCGAATILSKLWIFNTSYSSGISGIKTYNLYYAKIPSVALPTQPAKNVFAVTGLTPEGDYDFTGGGWTKFNSAGVLTAPQNAITNITLVGVTARYIGIEILSNHGDTSAGGRCGCDEVAVTFIPPPAGTVLVIK